MHQDRHPEAAMLLVRDRKHVHVNRHAAALITRHAQPPKGLHAGLEHVVDGTMILMNSIAFGVAKVQQVATPDLMNDALRGIRDSRSAPRFHSMTW